MSAAAKITSDNINIVKLNNDNYLDWSNQITLALKARGLHNFLTEEPINDTEEQKDARAHLHQSTRYLSLKAPLLVIKSVTVFFI